MTVTSEDGTEQAEVKYVVKHIDKQAPNVSVKGTGNEEHYREITAIAVANGYKREIPVNEGEEYTEKELVEMFTKPEWVTDNSGHAEFKVDKGGLEHDLEGYVPAEGETGSRTLTYGETTSVTFYLVSES